MPVPENFAGSISKVNDKFKATVSVALTKRDILLLQLCLNLVEQHHAKESSLQFEIQKLLEKLRPESGKMG